MALKLITPPAMELITLEEAKVHLRLELAENPEDVLISALITAAREWCERFREERFITQTWDYYRDDLPAEVPIPIGPIQHVEFINVKDSASAIEIVSFVDPSGTVLFETDDYNLDVVSRPARLVKKTGSSVPRVTGQIQALQMRLVVGYADLPMDVPENFRAAVYLMLTHLYEHRGDESQPAPSTVELLLRQDLGFPMP